MKKMPTHKFVLCLMLGALFLSVNGFAASGGRSQAPTIPPIIQKAELTASDGQPGSLVGSWVAISGNTVVVGAPGEDGFIDFVKGAVYVYTKPASGWENMTQVAKLTPSDSAADYYFGTWVAISGNTIVASSTTGEHVYVEPEGGWVDMTETAILTDANASPGGGLLAIEGNTIAVGTLSDENGFTGFVDVYVKPSSGWQTTSKPSARLNQPQALGSDQPNESVAINGKTIAAVGGDCSSVVCQGFVYLYDKPASGWKGMIAPTVTLSSSDSNYYLSRGRVAMSGNTVVATAEGPSINPTTPGIAYVWVEPAGGWTNMTETAQLTDGNTFYDQFGISTAFSGDNILVGTPSAIDIQTGQYYRGAVYVYAKPADGWQTTSTPNAQLLNSDWTQNDGFGSSIASGGGVTVVGEPYGPLSTYVGAAYVFEFSF